MNFRSLSIPLGLLLAGTLAGHFVWPRQRGIPAEEVARVNAAWFAAALETELSEAALTRRPENSALAKLWDFLQRLETTPAAEFPGLWEELKKNGNEDEGGYYPPQRSDELLLAERWAELDPEGAFAFFSGKKDSELLVAIVFRTWSRMNVETALAAVLAMDNDQIRDAAVGGIFNAASEDPASLIAWGRRLSFLDASKLEPSAFDFVVPPAALRSAFELDPAAVRELAAGMPPWFRTRLEAMTAARELATDVPAALARIDAAGLTRESAAGFLLDMLPLTEGHPDKLVAVVEHLTDSLGSGWLSYHGMQDFHLLFISLARAAPDKVHALLRKAAADVPIVASNQADAALDLFSTNPRLALQLAPAGDPWIGEFLNGAPLPQASAASPGETLELLRTAPSSTMRDGLLQEALTALMKSSPEAAAAWIEALPPGELKGVAEVSLRTEAFTPAQATLERAAVSAARGGDDAASLDRVRRATERFFSADPNDATARILAWPAGPVRDAALETAGRRWSDNSTPDALRWAESLSADAQPSAFAGILQTWARAEPAEASEFLNAVPPGPSRDAPAAGFARGLAYVDPATSLAWANTVQDPALRHTTLMEIAGRWLSSDADTARKGLQSVPGLTDVERRQLLTAPPPS